MFKFILSITCLFLIQYSMAQTEAQLSDIVKLKITEKQQIDVQCKISSKANQEPDQRCKNAIEKLKNEDLLSMLKKSGINKIMIEVNFIEEEDEFTIATMGEFRVSPGMYVEPILVVEDINSISEIAEKIEDLKYDLKISKINREIGTATDCGYLSDKKCSLARKRLKALRLKLELAKFSFENAKFVENWDDNDPYIDTYSPMFSLSDSDIIWETLIKILPHAKKIQDSISQFEEVDVDNEQTAFMELSKVVNDFTVFIEKTKLELTKQCSNDSECDSQILNSDLDELLVAINEELQEIKEYL